MRGTPKPSLAPLQPPHETERRAALDISKGKLDVLSPLGLPYNHCCSILGLQGVWEDHRMRKALFLLGAIFCFCLSASAQGPSGAGTGAGTGSKRRSGSTYELSQWQLSGGYQYERINLLGTPFNTNGLNVSAVRYFRRWLGAEGQLGFAFGNT